MNYVLPVITLFLCIGQLIAQVPAHTKQLFYKLPLEQPKEELENILLHDSLRFKVMTEKGHLTFLCLKKDSIFYPVPNRIVICTREVKPKGDSLAHQEIVLQILFEKGRYKEAKHFNKTLLRYARSDYKSFQGTQRKSRMTQNGKDAGDVWFQDMMFYEQAGMRVPRLEILWAKAGNQYENLISVSYRLDKTP